jgi:predicted helicase
LRVIIGNPPYSIGQKSANDNAQNQAYPALDARIAATYAQQSAAGLSKSLYDAYIKAFRWSTDQLDGTGGIVCFVSNGAWLDSNSTDGFRKSLQREFSSIYVFNLRGNQRTSGELSRKEGGKIFGSGSRTPITITLMVKNPQASAGPAVIHYHDIGDYLTREAKLDIIKGFGSMSNAKMPWQAVQPNEHGDWLAQRKDVFDTFIPIAPEKKFDLKSQTFFTTYAIGVSTNRDAWVYNSSTNGIGNSMRRMIEFYNQQKDGFAALLGTAPRVDIESFIDTNPEKISWTVNLKKDLEKKIEHKFNSKDIRHSLYRPFFKQQLYFDKPFIERPGLNAQLFPSASTENFVICVSGLGASKPFSALITNVVTSLDTIEKAQCFPLYYYEERKKQTKSLFDEGGDNELVRRDGTSDFILTRAKQQYGKNITKEDIFYYVYGLLNSPTYRTTFADDLKKMLPRLPLLDDVRQFWAFSKAGRQLAALHLDYEAVAPLPEVTVTITKPDHYKVDKMRFPKKGQRDTIHYNPYITVSNIPAAAYDYTVNGKSAIEWVMERYQVTTHKDSGITNNPNDWSAEHNQPRYILDLLLSVIALSVQTVDIVAKLPIVDFSGTQAQSELSAIEVKEV